MQIQISLRIINDILYYEDDTLFEKMFVVDEFSFTKDDHFGYADELTELDEDIGGLDYYKRLGCIIKGNDVIFPGGLTFKIIKKVHPDEPNTAFEITRNGENFPIVMWNPSEQINAELTKLGEKILAFAENNPYNIINAYESLKDVDSIFGTKIVGN